MTRPLPKAITELPAAEEADLERRSGDMADAERQIEIMRRGTGKRHDAPREPPR
jgi:hypothetical protein